MKKTKKNKLFYKIQQDKMKELLDNKSDEEWENTLKKKPNPLQEAFGSLKGWKIDSQKMKDEFREEDRRRDKKLSKWLKKKEFKNIPHVEWVK